MRVLILVLGMFTAVTSYAKESVFYCTYQNQTCVDSSAEMNLSESEISEIVKLVGAGDENFIGFVDSDGNTIEFRAYDVDDIAVEVQVSDKKGVYGKKIDQSEMESIVGSLKSPYREYIKSLELEFREG